MTQYQKQCEFCKQQITMSNDSGKWGAYELGGQEFHNCKARQSTQNAVKATYRGVDVAGEPKQYHNGRLNVVWFKSFSNVDICEAYNAFARDKNIKYSQSHAVAIGDSIEYSICVYYEAGEQ
jgi:hypothetical protein